MSSDKYDQMPPQERIQYLNQQVEKNPNNIELKKQLYQEYLNLGMQPQAVSVMEDLLILDPNQPDVQFEYGNLQYQSGNYKKAYRAFLSVMQSSSAGVYQSQIASYVAGSFLVQRLTSDTTDEGFPAFSADGKKILYQKKTNGNWNIVEFDLAAQSETQLTSAPADEETPVYSPGGSTIVYTSNREDHRPIDDKYKVREIVSMNRSDGYVTNLTQSVADDWLPRFSHDGAYLVFVSDRSDLRKVSYLAKQSDVFIMEKDGDFQLQLTKSPANEGGPCFSSDDKRIFFHSNKSGTYGIYVMKIDGSQVMTILDEPENNNVNPTTSPDGNHLAFVSDRDGNYEIYRANIDGSEQTRLTFHPGVDSNPVYSPDGESIAFHSNRSGNYDIYLINLNYPSSELTTNDLIKRLEELAN